MNQQNNNSHDCLLAIESSCDDTSASVIVNGKICSNVIASQKIHEEYGGVVPEWASRKHQLNIIPTVDTALKNAGITAKDVNAIACTQGPGLLGSLLVGYTFAKGFSVANEIPLINVNHIDAHVVSHFIDDPIPRLPFLCLLVSGGHTQIVKVTEKMDFEVIGKTLDDAAGEAFDKAGKLLGLPYPSGPVMDEYAKKGNPTRFEFSTSSVGELDFSFSGLKTSVLYFLQKQMKLNPQFISENLFDLCASIQHTIVSYLMSKLEKAADETGIRDIGIAGGVAANSLLRSKLSNMQEGRNIRTYIPAFEYCTDNAAMIAYLAYQHYKKKNYGTLNDVCFTRS